MARILLGVTGGIAAYKAVELVRLATGAGHAVRVVQTPASLTSSAGPPSRASPARPCSSTSSSATRRAAPTPGEPAPDHDPISHLELVRRADAFCIAPASANTLAKLAGGLADNLLTSAALACTAPLVIAPAMNNHMWEHPATQREPGAAARARRHDRGARERAAGLAGRVGRGPAGRAGRHPRGDRGRRSAAPAGPLDGLRVLVTAGGTREPIDSVRYVGNRSSGRMGLALAAEAARRGAEVTLIAANVALAGAGRRAHVDVRPPPSSTPPRARSSPRRRAADGGRRGRLPARRGADDKIAKSGRDGLALELEPTADVLAALAGARAPARR